MEGKYTNMNLSVLLVNQDFCFAATHSLKYFYTATSGLPNFPEFVTVGLMDGLPITYYDSNIRREKIGRAHV